MRKIIEGGRGGGEGGGEVIGHVCVFIIFSAPVAVAEASLAT